MRTVYRAHYKQKTGAPERIRLLRLRPPASGCVASPRRPAARLPARLSSLSARRRTRFESSMKRIYRKKLARLRGFEPLARCLEGSCSIHLSYRRASPVYQPFWEWHPATPRLVILFTDERQEVNKPANGPSEARWTMPIGGNDMRVLRGAGGAGAREGRRRVRRIGQPGGRERDRDGRPFQDGPGRAGEPSAASGTKCRWRGRPSRWKA